MKTFRVERTQHVLLRLHAGDTLPETLVAFVKQHQVAGGSVRLTGVLADVDVRAFSAEIEGQGGTKRIAGPVQAVILDGSVGVADGGPSVELRVVLARETDRGLETIAGELLRARVVGLDGAITVLEDTVVPRALDKAAGVWLLRDDGVVTAPAPARPRPDAVPAARPSGTSLASAPSPPASAPSVASWSDAATASAQSGPAQPSRPPTRSPRADDGDADEEQPTPQAGAYVEHFAFGPCEVLKSDGDRLHLRMKDGRIREIALEMLKVTPLPPDGDTPRFRLARRS